MPRGSPASSFTSTPVQKPLPAPVVTITRTASSASSSPHARGSSSIIATFIAL
jgi:hypothetical protein